MKRLASSTGYAIEEVLFFDFDIQSKRCKCSIVSKRKTGRPPVIFGEFNWSAKPQVTTRRTLKADGQIVIRVWAKPGFAISEVYESDLDPQTQRARFGVITYRRRAPAPDGDGEPAPAPEPTAA